MKWRKKPVVIEAMQYNGHNAMEIASFATVNVMVSRRMEAPMLITTLEGNMQANVGDWIIKGVKGEFYPCKPDIFEATYVSADEPEPDWERFHGEVGMLIDMLPKNLSETCGAQAITVLNLWTAIYRQTEPAPPEEDTSGYEQPYTDGPPYGKPVMPDDPR